MLDTNMASFVIKGRPAMVRQRLTALPIGSVVISVVTVAELYYGLARKGHPSALTILVHEFLRRVDTLPWDETAAHVYGDLRAAFATSGTVLGALDMMIAAHAVAANATLVTHDKAFSKAFHTNLVLEDWAS